MIDILRKFEKIEIVHDYSDEPRSGIADYYGKPYWFECIFDTQKDEYSNEYWLTPVTTQTVELCKERFEIFLRWRQAFDDAKVDLSTHPSLPGDRERLRQIETGIGVALEANANQRFKARGETRLVRKHPKIALLSDFEIRWSSKE